jgi:hypothetical protein
MKCLTRNSRVKSLLRNRGRKLRPLHRRPFGPHQQTRTEDTARMATVTTVVMASNEFRSAYTQRTRLGRVLFFGRNSGLRCQRCVQQRDLARQNVRRFSHP